MGAPAMTESEIQTSMKPGPYCQELSHEQLQDLRRHASRTVRWFVIFYIYMLIVFGAHMFFEPPEFISQLMIAVLFAAVIPAVMLQFAKRCPKCGANLGWQVRLGIPPNCKKCGVRLTEQKPSA